MAVDDEMGEAVVVVDDKMVEMTLTVLTEGQMITQFKMEGVDCPVWTEGRMMTRCTVTVLTEA